MSTLLKNRATVNKNIQSVSIIVTALHLCNVIFDIQDDLSNDLNDISIATLSRAYSKSFPLHCNQC